jgi:tripartite ATP-independent transporter DctM subunit
MGLVAILAVRRGWARHGAFSIAEILRTGRRAAFAFGTPAIIVGGLVLGVFTPSEGGAFAAVYAILLSMFVYRTLSLQGLYGAFVAALHMTGELLIIVSLSFALGSSLSSAQVPQALAGLIDIFTFGDGIFGRLLVLMVLAILAGMFLDPLIPVFVPVILPTLLVFNIDPIHFGVLMVMAVVIGQLTPPLAIALIITSRIAETDQMKVFVTNIPFFLLILAFTIVLMAVPELATWLPSQVQQ